MRRKKKKKTPISRMTEQEILRLRAKLVAAKSTSNDQDDVDNTLLIIICHIGGEKYGFELCSIFEVLQFPRITPVPGLPLPLKGVMQFRGIILPLFDLPTIIAHNNVETSKDICVVLGQKEAKFGIATSHIDPPRQIVLTKLNKSLNEDSKSPHVLGITDDGVIILDAHSLLSDKSLIYNSKKNQY